MPRGIEKTDLDEVHEIACDMVNATAIDDEILYRSRQAAMLATLETLRVTYGEHPSVLGTIGDYLEDPEERMRFYKKGLEVAREQNYGEEIDEILDSIRELEASLGSDPAET